MDRENINRLIQEAKAVPEPGQAADACLELGKICLENHFYSQASDLFQQSADLFSQTANPRRQVFALNQLAAALIISGQASQAVGIINSALKTLENAPDTGLSCALTGNLGLAYASMGNYQKAVKSHKTVLEIAERNHDQKLKLNALVNLAECNLLDGHLRPALGFALVGQDLAADLGSRKSAILIQDLLGKIAALQGNLKCAQEHHQKSYHLALEENDLHHQAVALANQALALESLTELDLAYQMLKQAQEIFIDINSDYQGKIGRDLARIEAALRNQG